jgi:hypothetical protein
MSQDYEQARERNTAAKTALDQIAGDVLEAHYRLYFDAVHRVVHKALSQLRLPAVYILEPLPQTRRDRAPYIFSRFDGDPRLPVVISGLHRADLLIPLRRWTADVASDPVPSPDAVVDEFTGEKVLRSQPSMFFVGDDVRYTSLAILTEPKSSFQFIRGSMWPLLGPIEDDKTAAARDASEFIQYSTFMMDQCLKQRSALIEKPERETLRAWALKHTYGPFDNKIFSAHLSKWCVENNFGLARLIPILKYQRLNDRVVKTWWGSRTVREVADTRTIEMARIFEVTP